MEGLAFSDSELPSLLPRDLSEHDRCNWLIASQAGWTTAGSPDDAVNDPDLIDPLGPGFFESLSRHQATAICHIDGWWECFPATSHLIVGAGLNLKRTPTHSEKWLRFAMDPMTPVFPDLND
jgi:hypothetical protein